MLWQTKPEPKCTKQHYLAKAELFFCCAGRQLFCSVHCRGCCWQCCNCNQSCQSSLSLYWGGTLLFCHLQVSCLSLWAAPNLLRACCCMSCTGIDSHTSPSDCAKPHTCKTDDMLMCNLLLQISSPPDCRVDCLHEAQASTALCTCQNFSTDC